TLKVFVPETKAELAGKVALVSVEEIPTVSLTLVTRFQLASTALMLMLKGVPAVRAVGVPLFPVPVAAAAASPGTSSSNLAKAPALTVIDGLVLGVLPPSLRSVAVTVALPAVFRVTLKV